MKLNSEPSWRRRAVVLVLAPALVLFDPPLLYWRALTSTVDQPGLLHIKNSTFASSNTDNCPADHWFFEERQPEASARRPTTGPGILLQASSETARGDLISSPFKLTSYRWIDVTVKHSRESGDGRLFVCLHPAGEPGLVDLAFLPAVQSRQKTSATVRLHSGGHEGDYSIAVAITGAGSARIHSVSAHDTGPYPRPKRPLFVLNISTPRPRKDPRPDFQRIAWHFGFPSLEMLHFTELSREKLEDIGPALIILPGITQEFLDEGVGGAMSGIRAAVRTSVNYGAPVVGVCFGHQILALMHGAGGGRAPESGPVKIQVVEDDPVFDNLPRARSFYARTGHSGMVTLPEGHADLIAVSDTCRTQVFRYKGKPWYTFQCHIESNWESSCPDACLLWKNMLRSWGVIR